MIQHPRSEECIWGWGLILFVLVGSSVSDSFAAFYFPLRSDQNHKSWHLSHKAAGDSSKCWAPPSSPASRSQSVLLTGDWHVSPREQVFTARVPWSNSDRSPGLAFLPVKIGFVCAHAYASLQKVDNKDILHVKKNPTPTRNWHYHFSVCSSNLFNINIIGIFGGEKILNRTHMCLFFWPWSHIINAITFKMYML